ncbi:hypothetical protein ACFVVX_20460 [Kitasatospora sp. NPDC058170]|uniref:hypothetical protein n=1 Tax=Kitasatospora sp. NPDC058170 TaxID=3346364 RepID=UPI0036D915AC
MTIRRTTLTTAAALLALSAVAACNDGDAQSAPPTASASATTGATVSASATPTATASAATPSPTATTTPTPAATAGATGAPVDASGAFDPAVALAQADRTPYSATLAMKTTATADGQGSVITASGRVNVNTPTYEARTETKMMLGEGEEPTLWMEALATGKGTYMRDKTKADSAWSLSNSEASSPQDTGALFAKALVEAGPGARKGMEQKNGVAAYHLGARMTVDQIKAIDPKEAQKMSDQGVNGKDYDVWIDRAGRILAQSQSMKVPRGATTVTSAITVTYTDFGPREQFTAPATTG